MYLNQNLKIQVRTAELPWADMEAVPEFTKYDEARAWMTTNGCDALQAKHDIEFRVVPLDTPAAATARLERTVEDVRH